MTDDGGARPSASPRGQMLLQAAFDSAGPFVDPVVLQQAHRAWVADPVWAADVLGLGAGATFRDARRRQLHMLVQAVELDHDWLAARAQRRQRAYDAEHANEAAARALVVAEVAQQWVAIVADLPVAVQVRHNRSRGHYERQVTGKDHVVVVNDLTAGLLQRPAWTALCENGSKSRDLTHLDRDPHSTYASERVPSCTACVKVAQRLTGRAVTGVLNLIGEAECDR